MKEFNPSGPRVHYKHRVSLRISIDKRKVNAKRGTSRTSSNSEYESSPEQSSDGDEEDEDEAEDESDYIGGRTLRSRTGKSIRRLPFSPKKSRSRVLRSRKGNDSDELENSSSNDEVEYQPRATRSRGVKSRFKDDESYDDAPRPAKRKAFKKKAVRPEYGKIRKVDDPYDSDPDTAALRAHRDICEKCRRQPSHILLRKNKRKAGRKRKDENGFSEDDEGFYQTLGGWVQWYVISHEFRLPLVVERAFA